MHRFTLALMAASALTFSSAMAADLIIEEPAMPGIVEVGGDWDGLFVGVFAGYASGELNGDTPIDGLDISGWLVGVSAGANFTLTDGIVAGIVGDIAWNDIETDSGLVGSNWAGSLRGRLGFDGGAFLPYLTAGVAALDGESATDDNVHVGWTAGAGVEFAVADNLSLDLLYRYSDYGSETYTSGGDDFEVGATTHQVSVGLNFGF